VLPVQLALRTPSVFGFVFLPAPRELREAHGFFNILERGVHSLRRLSTFPRSRSGGIRRLCACRSQLVAECHELVVVSVHGFIRHAAALERIEELFAYRLRQRPPDAARGGQVFKQALGRDTGRTLFDFFRSDSMFCIASASVPE